MIKSSPVARSTLLVALLLPACRDSSAPPEHGSPHASARRATPPPQDVSTAPSAAATNSVDSVAELQGRWIFELDGPGGALPFYVEIGPEGDAAVVNGHERLPFSSATRTNGVVRLAMDHYDSTIELVATPDGSGLAGAWRRRSPGAAEYTIMELSGSRDTGAQLDPGGGVHKPEVFAGRWALRFTESDAKGAKFSGVAELRETPNSGDVPAVEGTILTDTGDYRYLEGVAIRDQLKLSVFDGAHAFLFHVRHEDGRLVDGEFWSRDSYHARFTGERVPPGGATGLADPLEVVKLTNRDRRLRFDFPALGGGRVTHEDPRFRDKVVVVELFGTWCPNCTDQAPLMSDWYSEFSPRGVEMLGIAFEFTGDETRDMEMVSRYAKRFDVKYPLALGGTNDKQLAATKLPDLSTIAAYPTTVFIGRSGEVHSVYSGFSGPATGAAHEKLKVTFRETIEELLAEPGKTP